MPAAQRVLAQAGIDASAVAGTGPGGRVLKEDAEAAAHKLSEGQKIPLVFAAETAQPVTPAARPAAVAPPAAPAPVAAAAPAPVAPAAVAPAPRKPNGPRSEEVVPMTPLRKRVAQRLVEAQQTAAPIS
jgi:2-oxoglutarate dehydrogenase E2 component (dihydrolipoamide succinyltransferase)